MTYKNVGKPTFLFFILARIVTLAFGGVTHMKTNLAVSIGIEAAYN